MSAVVSTLSAWLGAIGLSLDTVEDLLAGWGSFAILLLLARQLERIRPIEQHDTAADRAEVAMDYQVSLANYLVVALLAPVSSACAVVVVNALGGGGFIDLEAGGALHWLGAVLVYLVMYDLYKYWVHRLEHMIPALWAMHSFHHSAERLTIITGLRHYWLLSFLTVAFFPLLQILFKMSPEAAMAVGVIYSLPDTAAHLNYRVPLGRFIVVICSPQWHRIHHSTQPEHFDKNFAGMLPVLDIIFGTAWVPKPDEYPATGLTPSDRCGLVGSMIWPFRRWLPGRRAVVPAA